VPTFTNPYPAWTRKRCSTDDHNAPSGEKEEKDPTVSAEEQRLNMKRKKNIDVFHSFTSNFCDALKTS
jgi:hypothetical protein